VLFRGALIKYHRWDQTRRTWSG